MNLHHTHLRLRVVLEQLLRIGKLTTLLLEVWTAVHLAAIGCRNGEMIGNIDTVVDELSTDVAVKQTEIDAFLQRFLAGGIENIVDDLVQQRLLVDITVAHNLLHGLRSIGQRVLVLTQNHRLGHRGRLHLQRLHLERAIDRAVVGSYRKLVGLLDGA